MSASPTELTPTPAEIITAAEEVTPAEEAPARSTLPPTPADSTQAVAAQKAQSSTEGPEAEAITDVAQRTEVTTHATDPWAKLVADPGRAPELLALASVQTLGPRAEEWASSARASYPNASNQALARLATKQFTRFGALGSAIGALAGAYAPAAFLASSAITQAELALHVAAAHGLDPTDPDRAADLLVIARVHPTLEAARNAITAAQQPAYERDDATLFRFARKVATQTSGWGLIKLANRYFPGTAFLTALLAGSNAGQTAAARADAYYRSQASHD